MNENMKDKFQESIGAEGMSKNMNFTEEYVLINGIQQYFLHYPSPNKEVLLHLHGGPGSSMANAAYMYSPVLSYCSVVFYDQRGAGKTLKKNKTKSEDLSIETLIADLRQTIAYVKEKYATDRVILLGQSWGSLLGTQYILKYPADVIGYIGTGHCIDTRRDMKIIYSKLEKLIADKGNKKDAKKLEALKNLPHMKVDDKNYVAADTKFTLMKSKYGLNLKTGKLLKIMFKSPIFKLSDIWLMIKGVKINFNLTKSLTDYSIWDTTEYAVPVFYILGRNDWQTSSVLASEYFERINAPNKKLFWVENAGHVTDLDNPTDFMAAVKEIIVLYCGGTGYFYNEQQEEK
ncbi:MAG: alpha/beta fold hydrolase [Defluviitaleaceae bacterium]|nr:alpha/beta fold hydrolase [Defluviitaleaceae bacterium]